MNINALISLQATVKQAVKLPEIPQWQVGQLLKAVVESKTGKQQVTLKVGDGSLTTTLQVPVRIGDKLTLEVIKTGQLPVLRLLPEGSKVDRISQNLRQLLPQQRELPVFLSNIQRASKPAPQQPPLPPSILKAARALIQGLPQAQDIRKTGVLKQAVQQSGLFLEARLLKPQDRATTLNLTSDFKANVMRLREAINQQLNNRTGAIREQTPLNTRTPASGTIAREGAATPPAPTAAGSDKTAPGNIRLPDARLGPGTRPAAEQTAAMLGNPYATTTAAGRYAAQAQGSDNSGLAQLLKHLFPQPQARAEHHIRPGMTQEQLLAQLFKDSDSALARTQMSQLASQQTESDQRQLWILELPVRRGEGFDVFHVRIEKEGGTGTEEQQPRWTVSIAFELEELGPVHARVSLVDERITSSLWIEREESLELFRNHLQELRSNMTGAGLEVEELHLHAGSPVHTDEAELMTDSKLVDYTA